MASRVAKAIISAQETIDGHAASSLFLALSITSNPRTVRFGPAAFSDGLFLVESISIDASQPYNIKKMLDVEKKKNFKKGLII